MEYGFLGVTLDNTSSQEKRGVGIRAAIYGSPAHKAHIGGGDTIVGINGLPIRDTDDLFLLVGTHLAGSTVRLEVMNGSGEKRTVPVTLGKYWVPGPIIAANRPAARFGLRVDHGSIWAQRTFNPRMVPEGVVVREVVPESPADKANLQVDKIISQVNGHPVTSPAEFYQAIAKAGRSVEITLLDPNGREGKVTLEGK